MPVGWVAVEPRTEYPRLLGLPTVWRGRHEDKQDDGVWSVTCFVVRKGYRKRGISYALAAATVGYARENGARALEGYAMRTQPGKEITWGELHVGAVQVVRRRGLHRSQQPQRPPRRHAHRLHRLRRLTRLTLPAASAAQRGAVRVQVPEQPDLRAVMDHLIEHVQHQVHRVRLGVEPQAGPSGAAHSSGLSPAIPARQFR